MPAWLGSRRTALVFVVGLALLLTGCTSPPAPAVPASAGRPASLPVGTLVPDGEPTDVATNLAAPWSMAFLPDGSFLVSERGSALIKEITAGGATRIVGKVDGVVPGGEGGLLGLAPWQGPCADTASQPPCLFLFVYVTAKEDNRVLRLALDGAAGSYTLGSGVTTVLTGIAKASNHDGGRIAVGPDGLLYITTGDAGNGQAAQDRNSLSGKILRLKPDGTVPADNPFPGNPVFSLGHRNSQGIAWDSRGRMWAAEFGQNTWDELNLILPGHNYGWPIVEGIDAHPDARFTNPVLQWATSEASPSGMAIRGTTIYLAALKGERLWVIQPSDDAATAAASAYLSGRFGRLRDVRATPDGGLWVLTNNTDGRGTPRPGDDRILSVHLAALP
ncbi:PQQ-dependent sugar dehydrogenase [Paenarthrobacter sp. Z7-10]|nr:PQQ-dependent sugar dehydrogenase [Paenarthrobacter sp. Z7-10]